MLVNFGAFTSGSTFAGGRGGDGVDFIGSFGGDGGTGMVVAALAQLQVLDSTWTGGDAGVAQFGGPNGSPGADLTGSGVVNSLGGSARRMRWALVHGDTGHLSLEVEGQAGDRVFWTLADRTAYRFSPGLKGVSLIPYPSDFPLQPLGTVPASGSLQIQVPLPDVQAPRSAWLFHGQGYVLDAQGQAYLSGGRPLLVLDRDHGIDCDSNGAFDLVDVIEGTTPDCDGNLSPDSCDVDCNLNGVPDPCDIASGTSTDHNGNGIPDECELLPTTVYVDAGAAPGGDGSLGAPFRTIQQGVDAALESDTVRILDGIYTGPGNRDITLQGRDITIASMNGPGACILDCQLAGRAFLIQQGESLETRIEGLTVRGARAPQFSVGGGAVWISSPGATFRDCVFESCRAIRQGGAILAEDGSEVRIEGCVFRNNRVDLPGFGSAEGGAVAAFAPLTLVACRFEGNSAQTNAGALWIAGSAGASISHCQFLDNIAEDFGGGAIQSEMQPADPLVDRLYLDNCLFAGNRAGRGGALEFISPHSRIEISNSTLAGNHAGQCGGALTAFYDNDIVIVNSILWGNTAGTGSQVCLQFSGNTLAVGNSTLEGGQAGVVLGGSSLHWGAGNLAGDPRFTDPDGPDLDPSTGIDGDYRPMPGSPVIDAGDFTRVPADRGDIDGDGNTSEQTPWDLDLSPRIVDDPTAPNTGFGPPWVDMGAYER